MKKSFLLGKSSLFSCLIILILASCNNIESSPGTGDTAVSTGNPETKPVQAQSAKISGFLNILFTDTLTFRDAIDTNTRKLTFRFYLKDPDSLTLHGWSNVINSENFPANPDLELWVGGASAYEFGYGNYFGNLVLYNRSIRVIMRRIRAHNAKFVLFVPLDPAANNGQIKYEVFVTRIDPTSIKSLSELEAFAPTGEQTNPSPPRNGNTE